MNLINAILNFFISCSIYNNSIQNYNSNFLTLYVNFTLFSIMYGNSIISKIILYNLLTFDKSYIEIYNQYCVNNYGLYYKNIIGLHILLIFILIYTFNGFYKIIVNNLTYNFFSKKIQNTKINYRESIYAYFISILNLIFVGFPYIIFLCNACNFVNFSINKNKSLNYQNILKYFFSNLIINEILFYYSHRLLHTPKFYKIHKLHHHFKSPNTLTALYCHPIEFLISNLIPLTSGFLIFGIDIYFVLIWIVGACLGTQYHHSGYRHILNFTFDDNPNFHDLHHKYFNCNYGHLGILDRLHRTIYKKST